MATKKQKALAAKIEQEEKAEALELQNENAKLYAKGFRYWVVAWVHPKGGGDDYMIDLYSNQIHTQSYIIAQLKKKRSSITNDYGQFELNPDGTSKPINTPL